MDAITRTLYQKKLFTLWAGERAELKGEFERVAIPHLAHLFTAALYLTKNREEADDLVQETYLRAYRFFNRFEPGTNCKAWLLTILRRLFLNGCRRKQRFPDTINWEKVDQDYEALVLAQDEVNKYNPESLYCAESVGSEVHKALQALPEDFRTAIILVDVNELTYEEAARVMECAVGTIRSRLSRARRLLQLSLRDYVVNQGRNKE